MRENIQKILLSEEQIQAKVKELAAQLTEEYKDKDPIFIGVLKGVVIFFALFLLGAALSIYTIEGIEVINVITDGGREFCQYPADIYGDTMKKIFTYIIPFAAFNYLPMKFIFDMPNATILGNALAPLYGCLFIIPAFILFNVALKKYSSTGS